MFRVVWSESRFYLVGAEHHTYDESAGGASKDATVRQRQKDPNLDKVEVGYKWLPLYPGKGHWVLEMWKSAAGFTGCSPEQYEIQYRNPDTGLLTLGPYPSRGEYAQCHSYPSGYVPTYTEVCTRIQLIKKGWDYSVADHKIANEEALKYEELGKLNRMKDMFLDAQQAFKNKASSVRPGKRTKDDIRINRSANQLKLKTKTGFSAGTPRG